jgi:FixJ family two-component response regulator
MAKRVQCSLSMTPGGVRTVLSRVLTASGYQARPFEPAERFLGEQDAEAPGCLLRLP